MVTETELKSALGRIDELEVELSEMRAALLKKEGVVRKPLKGLWKGVTFSDDDIDEAKRSWLKKSDD